MDVRVEPYRKLSAKAFMLLNCDVGEDTWESRGLQGCQSSQSKRKKSWIFIERTDAEAETPILWSPDAKNWLLGKKPDAGKDWRQEEKGTTGWDGWIALLSPLTWVWASSRNWWWRDKPVMLQSMKLQSWTWLSNWTELNLCGCKYIYNYYIFFSDWFLDHCVVSFLSLLISSFQSLSCVRLFVTPWIAARQASLSITNSRVYQNSCPVSWWYYPVVSSSVVPLSSCPQSFPASGSLPMSQLFAWGGQSIGVSASASVLPMNTQDSSPSGWTGWISLQSKGLSRVFSNTTDQKHQFFSAQLYISYLFFFYQTPQIHTHIHVHSRAHKHTNSLH